MLARIRPPYLLYFALVQRPPPSTLFPYTTLFRSSSRIAPRIRTRTYQSNRSDRSSPCLRMASQSPHIPAATRRSEEHTSELQSRRDRVCRLLLEKKKPRAGKKRTPPSDGRRADAR